MNTNNTPENLDTEADSNRLGKLYSWQSIIFSLLCFAGLCAGIFYIFGFTYQGARLVEVQYYWIFVGIFSAAAFIALPGSRRINHVPVYDIAIAATALGIGIYFSLHAQDMVLLGWTNLPLGITMWLMLMELARRSAGMPFLLVILILGLYPLVSHLLPGLLKGMSYSFPQMVQSHIFRSEGLMGVTTKVVAEIILGFLVFAGILIATGAGDFFINLANSLFGRYRGGPAKVSIIASGLFGSLSGSIFSNIAGTGSITIRTMKKVGYPAHYAGAIEACASTGGALMPPVMGAIAFVMAVTIGVDYRVVLLAAIIPSFLYYLGLILQVDAYAAKTGLAGLPREDIPSFKKVLVGGWPYMVVLVFLVWGLLFKRWEYYAPWYASILMIGLSFLNKNTWMSPRRLFDTLRQIGILVTQTGAIILPIAFVVSGLTITGVTGSVTSGLVELGGGNLFLVLLFGVGACFIMGMAGLAIVAYIFLAVTLAPALIKIGDLNVVAVHFFIIYYAMLSVITPPVGAAAFLAATIAGSTPMKTTFTAMRLGVVIYFIPLFFLFQPALVGQGDLVPLLYILPSIIVGIALIAGGLEGYLLGVGHVIRRYRLPLIISGFILSFPGWIATTVGLVSSGVIVVLLYLSNRAQLSEQL